MVDNTKDLKGLKKEKDFLICIDSDGCAINSMEIKHKQYFGPMMIKTWELDDISEHVLEVWNFVNLYSVWRGINRFKGLVKVFELLQAKKAIIDQGRKLPKYDAILKWVEDAQQLSNPVLETAVKESDDRALEKALEWSKAVNKHVAAMSNEHKTFQYVKETLAQIQQYADVIVVSSANEEALKNEWSQQGISQYAKVLASQEMGSKTYCIGAAMANNGESHPKKYDKDHVMMIGDAPGDLEAAKDNHVLFYPIIPGQENRSWKRLLDEALDYFFNEQYKGEYEDTLITEFNKVLPSRLPWE